MWKYNIRKREIVPVVRAKMVLLLIFILYYLSNCLYRPSAYVILTLRAVLHLTIALACPSDAIKMCWVCVSDYTIIING